MHDLCKSVVVTKLRELSETKIEDVFLNRVCMLGIFCPKQGQGFKPSAAHPYPNIGRVPPPPGTKMLVLVVDVAFKHTFSQYSLPESVFMWDPINHLQQRPQLCLQ